MNRSLILFKWLRLFFVLGCWIPTIGIAANKANATFLPPLACNDVVQISLNTFCRATVTPEMVLEDMIGVAADYTIQVYYKDGSLQPDLLFDASDIRQTYSFKIWHNPSGNSCWGKIFIEDKYPPEMICERDTVRCGDTIAPEELGFPIPSSFVVSIDSIGPTSYLVYGWDYCGSVILSYTDIVKTFPCDSYCIRQIIREWWARDESGNSSHCSDTICVIRPTFQDIVYPHHFDDFDLPHIDCDTLYPKLANGHPSPDFTGWPVPSGCTTLNASYSDLVIPICGSSYKILRRWIILNWCGGDIIEYNQIIKIVDDEAPEFKCPKDLTMGMQAYSCSSYGKLPVPDSVYDCSDWHYEIFTMLADSKSGTPQTRGKTYLVYDAAQDCYFLDGAPEGRIWIIYQLTDVCGNQSTCTIEVGVVDNLAPIPVCDQKTVVALNVDGTAKAYAYTFDDGSLDNCGIDSFKVRRMDDPCKTGSEVFGDYVWFCCEDVGKTIQVILQVSDFYGNKNTCMIEATVQDKEPPVVIPPTDITVECTFPIDWNNLSQFGVVRYNEADRQQIIIADPYYQKSNYIAGRDGIAFDNCEVQLAERYEKYIQCNSGTIVRWFVATDRQGLKDSAYQLITIINSHKFDSLDIHWPDDVTIYSCDNVQTHPDQTKYPWYDNKNCAQIAANYTDTKLFVADSTCFKIIRHWVVIDWCQYDRNDPGSYWEHTQVIAVKSSEPPTIESCGPVEFCDQNAFYNTTTTQCLGSYKLEGKGFDDCTEPQNLIWNYRLDENNDGSFGPVKSGNATAGVLPIGTHRLRWILTDQCGNSSTCDQVFTIKECKKPTPYCINGIVTVVMQGNGTITVWAKDLNLNSFDNCTQTDQLRYSFSPDIKDVSITYNCDSLFRQRVVTKTVRVYVTDEYGNQDYCETTIRIQDNNNVCPTNGPGFNLSGKTNKENADAIGNVEIAFHEPTTGSALSQQTSNPSGNYTFQDLQLIEFYLTASKNDDITNGVTTLDIVLIQRHILGLKPLNSPYKILAADVNNSKSITARDVSDIRRAILGITTEFPNATPVWKFVPAYHQFADSENPWDAPSYIDSKELQDRFNNADFTGIKTGDVDLSAISNSKEEKSINRAESFSWNIGPVVRLENGLYRVDIQASKDQRIDGFQLGIKTRFDNLQFVDLVSGTIAFEKEEYKLTDKQLKISWASNVSMEIKNSDILFSIILNDAQKTQLDKSLFEGIAGFLNEVYYNDQAFPLKIGVSGKQAVDLPMITSHSLSPNPFSEESVLRFELHEQSLCQLKLFDLTGKLIMSKELTGVRGNNEVIIHKKELGSGGLFYYVLSSSYGSVSDRMIVQD